MTKKKVVKRTGLNRRSPDLLLNGEMDKETRSLLKRVRRNAPEPVRWQRQKARWDHFINMLNVADAVPLEHKIASSVATRARKLGYVAKITKLDDTYSEIWFGGYDPLPVKSKQVK